MNAEKTINKTKNIGFGEIYPKAKSQIRIKNISPDSIKLTKLIGNLSIAFK